MCFYSPDAKSREELQQYIRIAKKDMTVYKVMERIWRRGKRVLISPFYGMAYKRGVYTPRVPLRMRYCRDQRGVESHCFFVSEGYHVYRTRRVARYNCDFDGFVVKATIKKGTRYAWNETQIVAERIKINRP